MTNNIKKLCLYCLDCIKSTAKGNMKAEKTIITIDGVFNADNKEINDLLIKSKLNQSTMSLIYGFKWFIKENNTPLLYYSDIEIIRESDKIKILFDDDNLTINFNFLASLFDNDIEIVENITEQLTDFTTIDLKNIDLDLTTYSSTMVYTEVYNMMLQPKEYKGKTVKIKGLFATYCEESTGVNYFACIVQDATACCSQGIEFSLTGDYTYPEDYPKEGEEITVVGVFDTYKEVNSEYIVLKNAMII